MTTPTKADLVRDTVLDLSPDATNSEIAAHCLAKHGVKLTPQNVYSTLGRESERRLCRWDGRQLADIKRTVKTKFGGDFREMINCTRAAYAYSR